MITTGCYLEKNISAKKFLKDIKNPLWNIDLNDDDFCYEDARIFLNGSCQLFAYALNEKFGYEVFEIKNLSSVGSHYFCRLMIADSAVYIDVRGATTNFDDFLYDFQNIDKKDHIIIEHYREELDAELKENGAKFGYRFAKFLVNEYEQFYDKDIILSGE